MSIDRWRRQAPDPAPQPGVLRAGSSNKRASRDPPHGGRPEREGQITALLHDCVPAAFVRRPGAVQEGQLDGQLGERTETPSSCCEQSAGARSVPTEASEYPGLLYFDSCWPYRQQSAAAQRSRPVTVLLLFGARMQGQMTSPGQDVELTDPQIILGHYQKLQMEAQQVRETGGFRMSKEDMWLPLMTSKRPS